MAGAQLNPIFEGISRSIGSLVFYNMNGETVIRRKPDSSDPHTPAQMEVRGSFQELVQMWGSLGDIIKLSWEVYAHARKRRGYNVFIGENSLLQRQGQSVELAKNYGNERLDFFSATTGANGEIICTFTPSPLPSGRHITLFTAPVIDGRSDGSITRHDTGAHAESPQSITGLAPGITYAVYAVVTDQEFDRAAAVSASRGVLCRAGN